MHPYPYNPYVKARKFADWMKKNASLPKGVESCSGMSCLADPGSWLYWVAWHHSRTAGL